MATGLCLLALAVLSYSGAVPDDALLVYCSHDSVYSEEILRDFEERTGIPVIVRFDTEATKSLGLINLLIAEKDHPQCDVFWNNEVLGTMKLQDQGLLHPYRGSGYERIPARFKSEDGTWTGFAARLRVYIVNREMMEPSLDAIDRRLSVRGGNAFSGMAVAKPMYGTTLTHYSALWHEHGGDWLEEWHRESRERGLLELNGNSVVMHAVSAGQCDFGWTDTDDFFLAVDAGKPVKMVPVRLESDRTICIPNSVAIIRGTRQLANAQKLIDYLLSEEVETRLAGSPSRQIPLGPVETAVLPEQVRELIEPASQGIDLRVLRKSHADCLAWLQDEYLQ